MAWRGRAVRVYAVVCERGLTFADRQVPRHAVRVPCERLRRWQRLSVHSELQRCDGELVLLQRGQQSAVQPVDGRQAERDRQLPLQRADPVVPLVCRHDVLLPVVLLEQWRAGQRTGVAIVRLVVRVHVRRLVRLLAVLDRSAPVSLPLVVSLSVLASPALCGPASSAALVLPASCAAPASPSPAPSSTPAPSASHCRCVLSAPFAGLVVVSCSRSIMFVGSLCRRRGAVVCCRGHSRAVSGGGACRVGVVWSALQCGASAQTRRNKQRPTPPGPSLRHSAWSICGLRPVRGVGGRGAA